MPLYIIMFAILSMICPIQTMCNEIQEQLLAFSKGAASTSLGMLAGYIAGNKVNQKAVGTAAGAICGVFADHYWFGGKNDPHVARKIGYTLPIMVGGVIIRYKIDDFLAFAINERRLRSNLRNIHREHLNEISTEQGYKELDTIYFVRLQRAVFDQKDAQYQTEFQNRFGFILTNDSLNELFNQCSRLDESGAIVGNQKIDLTRQMVKLLRNRGVHLED